MDMDLTVKSNKLNEIVSRIERLPATSWQVKARMIVGVATFFDGFAGLIIAAAISVLMVSWHLKPQQAGILISSGFLGQVIGAIFFGWVAERYGRLRTTILTILVYAVFSFLCATSWDYTSLFIFRLIQGFGLGERSPSLRPTSTRSRRRRLGEDLSSYMRYSSLLAFWEHLFWGIGSCLGLDGARSSSLVAFPPF